MDLLNSWQAEHKIAILLKHIRTTIGCFTSTTTKRKNKSIKMQNKSPKTWKNDNLTSRKTLKVIKIKNVKIKYEWK